jgi:hypothetical protein
MKKMILIAAALMSLQVAATEVKDARFNYDKNVIEVDVAYGGGCKEHKFELEMSGYCLESYPVQCSAKIVDQTYDDYCEAYIHRTVEFTLEEAGLDDGYYNGASITITGSNKSAATLRLPFVQ